ncbi:sensor histidine kinase [Taibaiella koreensis]|uniref:sensor histidine kinase n=1 Tax=Taibaiella koreensis TaxID=1268548 RepID=UPI000E59A49B|nr:ATP-binding protein [Taibaiella koreensis]
MNNKEILTLFLSGTILFMAVGVFVILILVAHKNRQVRFASQQEKLKAENEHKVLLAKVEAQERSMNSLSMELHDNISQLLYLMQTNLKVIARTHTQLAGDKLMLATTDVLETIVRDIKNLGRSLNGELMKGLGLVSSLEAEVARLNSRQQLQGNVAVEGIVCTMPQEQELMIFRIAQEAIHNVLKHSGARLLHITLQYSYDRFRMDISDNGKGFSKEALYAGKGIGMLSMHHRARLIGGDLELRSVPGEGTAICFSIPLLQQ